VLDTIDDDSDQNSGRPKRSAAAFLGAFLLNVLLGTLYCWSCYLVPLEQALGVGRGLLSGVFSLATICFTVAVAKLGPWLYAAAPPAVIGTGAAVCAGTGLLFASRSIAYVSAAPLFLGYGVVFGAASGVGYGLSVQMASRAPFGEGLSTGDAGRAMSTMGCALLASAPFIYGVLATDGMKHPLASQKRDKDLPMTTEEEERERQLGPAMFALWISLGLGVSAGLMLMAHASALLYSHGASIGVATAGVSIVSVFTTAGRIFGGWGCDRSGVGAERVLRWAPFVAVPALAGAAVAANSVAAAQGALAAASIVYGVFASVIPVEVRRRTGSRDFARQFGKVYTAWGFAGLAAPVAAGCLFEARGDYTAALVAATALCILSAMVVRWMLKPGRSHEEWKEAIAEAKRAKAEEDAANGISQVIAP
jgi:OFA family oxalate/formate antiporter-like MFS transporter